MFKNTASQKVIVYAFDSTANTPKTGDAANLTAYVSKDYGSVTVLGDTSATEMDATNAKGYYLFDLTQAETNADTLLFSAKSSTANIVVLAMPATVYTVPANFTKLVIDASGLADANAVKVGPTGAGTAQTARDIGASVLLSTGTGAGQLDFTSGVVKANATQWLGGTIPAVNVTGVPLVDLKYTLGTISPATAGSVRADAVTGAVGSVTGAVGSVTGAVGSVTGAVGSVTGAVGSVTGNVGGNVTGTVASVVDISTTTLAESASVPAATATPLAKLNFIATVTRNKITETATTQLVRNDGDSGTIATSTVSDDGTTFTRGRFS